MVTNGLTIKPQVPAVSLQIGTMIGFAQAGSTSALSHAWSGVESRVWGNIRESDRYGVAFPIVKLGSMALAWRRGVEGQVEDVLRGRGPEAPHH